MLGPPCATTQEFILFGPPSMWKLGREYPAYDEPLPVRQIHLAARLVRSSRCEALRPWKGTGKRRANRLAVAVEKRRERVYSCKFPLQMGSCEHWFLRRTWVYWIGLPHDILMSGKENKRVSSFWCIMAAFNSFDIFYTRPEVESTLHDYMNPMPYDALFVVHAGLTTPFDLDDFFFFDMT